MRSDVTVTPSHPPHRSTAAATASSVTSVSAVVSEPSAYTRHANAPKMLALDTQALEGIYRVLVFLVVGAIMLGASFLYQRTRGTAADDSA